MANLKHSRSRIPDAQSVKLTLSKKPFILLKLKTKLKNVEDNSHTIALSKGAILPKKS